MQLTLSVLRCPDSATPEVRRSGGGDLTLGRGPESDWQLADPDRVLSKRHCTVEYRGGFWQLRDLSTNGTFVNHGDQPVGRDLVVPLNDGDRVRLGSYEIEVRIAGAANASVGADPGWGAPALGAAVSAGGGRVAADPFAAPLRTPLPTSFPGGGLPGAATGGLPEDFDPFAGIMPDHQPSTSDAFLAPRVTQPAAALPDDWAAALAPQSGAPAAAPPGADPFRAGDATGVGAADPFAAAIAGLASPAAPSDAPTTPSPSAADPFAAALAGLAPPLSPSNAPTGPPPSAADPFAAALAGLAPPVPAPAPTDGARTVTPVGADPFAPAPTRVGQAEPAGEPKPAHGSAAPMPAAPERPATHAIAAQPAPPSVAPAPVALAPVASTDPFYEPERPAPVSPQAASTMAGADAQAALAAFLRGAGLAPAPAGADPHAQLEAAGAALRAAVAGLRALLIARADVKREFRIEQTMLRAAGNNPLKFAASDDAALGALLAGPNGARAVAETIGDLTTHEVATLAATQAAARALLQRLAPEGLEADATGGGGLFGGREKKLWDAYRRLHAQVTDQFEDDFDSAFGKEFARAYEAAAKRG